MSIKNILNKKSILFIIIGITLSILIFVSLYSFTKLPKPFSSPPQVQKPTKPPSAIQTTTQTESDFQKFIKQYQFMFWNLPNSAKSISMGWMGDTPIVIKDQQIFNPYKNTTIRKLTSTEIAILDNNGEALIISPEKQKNLNLGTLVEKDITQKEREYFSYIWYEKPNSIIALSEDKKSLYIVNLLTNQKSEIAKSLTEFNPVSITSNNKAVAATDREYLYLYIDGLNKIKLDDTTKESITFWVKNELYLVEKVTKPRILDFIMLVDIEKQQFKQIITSSSQINRLNLKIRPSVNQKNDMVLFSENNGLVWILSKDQAITRIYPELKLPPEAWSNSAP